VAGKINKPKFSDVTKGIIALSGLTSTDPSTLGSIIRYGVTPEEKMRLLSNGQIPGAPSSYLPSGEENPEAVRYASNYLGNRYGHLPSWVVAAGNEIALGDLTRTPEYAAAVKRAGDAGAQRAQDDIANEQLDLEMAAKKKTAPVRLARYGGY
jgi:hypothetical protein